MPRAWGATAWISTSWRLWPRGSIPAARLDPGRAVDAWLVDEIGKMECLSPPFVTAMRRLLDGRAPVVATVGQRGGGFVAEVKRRPDAELRTLSRGTRDALPEAIAEWVTRVR